MEQKKTFGESVKFWLWITTKIVVVPIVVVILLPFAVIYFLILFLKDIFDDFFI